jgi:16S rRNA processing protein RimM
VSNAVSQVVVGEIVGVYGIKGWVKVKSFTEPRENLLAYQPWLLSDAQGREVTYKLCEGRMHGKGLIARLESVEDRDAAAAFMGYQIRVERDSLGTTEPGQYFWSDLCGLAVETADGVALGQVRSLIETGANDVLVVEGERRRLIPFVQEQVVKSVDLDSGRVVVDWDPDF